jgi:hypothetical protein
MKTKYFFILLIFLSVFCCSKDESDEDEPISTITRCFTVKELGTEISILNARVFLMGPIICSVGCGPIIIGNKVTDIDGEVCFLLSKNKNEEILKIICLKDGYSRFEVSSPSLDFSEIYLEPMSN